jgi:hypothetical protein
MDDRPRYAPVAARIPYHQPPEAAPRKDQPAGGHIAHGAAQQEYGAAGRMVWQVPWRGFAIASSF